MPSKQQVDDLVSLLETNAPLVVIESHEELRALAVLERAAKSRKQEIWTWSAARGLRAHYGLPLALADAGGPPDAEKTDSEDTRELPNALEQLRSHGAKGLLVFLDVHPYLSNPVITRAFKEMAQLGEQWGLQLVFMGHSMTIPDELMPYANRFEIEHMTLQRVQNVFKDEIDRYKVRAHRDVTGCSKTLESLTRHLIGLPEATVRQLVRRVLSDGEINTADLTRVLAAKQESLGVAELLVFENNLPTLTDVAGMKALKRWLITRREPFLKPDESGLPAPRGVMLLGVQGAGKSLAAKAVAASWIVPLFRMDFGALFDKFQGESERKLRAALKVADAMSPCVLWMDEIEKGLAGGQGDGDTGAGKRMLATLLTWMAERRSSVFLVATANDIDSLPPELMRKGRFDEIFFVDLPTPEVREGIFRIHLAKHKVAFDDTSLAGLVTQSEGFSGAEIEAAVVAARYEAAALGDPAEAAMVKKELTRTKPLSVTRAEAIERLRDWAADRTVSSE